MTLTNEHGFRRLNPAIQYNLYVLKADYKASFKENNTDVYIFKLIFQDSYGYRYNAEYISETKEQHFFVPGKQAIFRVIRTHPTKDDAVGPVNEEQDVEKKLILSLNHKVDASDISWRALDMASNILISEKNNSMNPVTDHDIDRMLGIADRIEDYMLTKMSLRANDATGM